jgi:hypothetical protein
MRRHGWILPAGQAGASRYIMGAVGFRSPGSIAFARINNVAGQKARGFSAMS